MAYNYSYTPSTITPQADVNNITPGSTNGTDKFDIQPFMQSYDFSQDEAQQGEFRGRFGNWLEGLETPEATRQRYENRYGYQPLKEQYQQTSEMMGDVGSAIQAKPEQVLARGRNTVMTSAQLDQINSKEVGDLMKIYSGIGQINEQQGNRLASIEQSMNTAASLEIAQQQKMMTPWLQEYQDITVMQARKFSGWTIAGQSELDRLLANQSAGLTWSNAEANRANALAQIEAQFQNSLEKMEKENEYAVDLWGLQNPTVA